MQDQPRLHVAPTQPLSASLALPMHEAQAHYLGTVLRRGVGDAVRLFNARDGEWLARIEQLRRGAGGFLVTERLRPPATRSGPMLLFAPVKRDATDLIVRMATELGVQAIQPVLTERTNTARLRLDRLVAIATEAAEQCERLDVPSLAEPVALAPLLASWPADRSLAAAIERAHDHDAASPNARADAVLIGPEGGFTPRELDGLRARPFVTAVSLGSRILRAETAVAAALACLQCAREQWGSQQAGPPIPQPPVFLPAMPMEPDVQPR